MANNLDGYRSAGEGLSLGRLREEIRELDRSGVERIAAGWRRHVGDSEMDHFRSAEQSALQALERAGRVEEWRRARAELEGLTQGEGALATWRSEAGEALADARRAVLAAALGLLAGAAAGREDLELLLHPAGEALPWLLVRDSLEHEEG